MSAWEHPSKDLFRAGRGALAPSSADRERVRARLAAKLGAAAVGAAITTTSATAGGATAATAAAGTAKGGVAALVAKIALPLVLVGGAATIAAPHLAKKNDAPVKTVMPAAVVTNAPVTTPAPSPADTATPTATMSVSDLPTATAKAAPSTSALRAKTAPADPAEEARAVAAIDDALRAGDAAQALRLADDHAKRFPNGVLVEEREGGRAIARCMSGSRSSADAFLAAHPRSPMRGRIVAACGEKP